MAEHAYVALADSSRAELRTRIALALKRFVHLIRDADPLVHPTRSRWSVEQTAAHVLTIAHRYCTYASTGDYRRAETADQVARINQDELTRAVAPLAEIADELLVRAETMDGFFDTHSDDARVIPFHAGARIDGITTQTNWLGELLLHGEDIARGLNTPWRLDERDMLLIARGLMQIAPAYVRRSDVDLSVAVHVPAARPYIAHIHGGVAELRALADTDRPDAVIRTPASTLTQLLYQRIGPMTAATRGLRVVGGRRPWRALKLQSCFEPA